MTWTKHHANAISRVFRALDEEGVRYLVLRNYEGLPNTNRSKDVDLAFARADFQKAHSIISRAVSEVGFSRVLVQDFQYVRCLTYFATNTEKVSSIKIDILDGFVFRGAQLFAMGELMARAQEVNGFYVPSVVDDAVMLYVKPLLTGGIVKEKYVPDIVRAVQCFPREFFMQLERLFGRRLSQAVFSKIASGKIQSTRDLKTRMRVAAWCRALLRAPVTTTAAAVRHAASELGRRYRRNPGTVVAVLGPDGVGKSTFIQGLADGLQEIYVKDSNAMRVHHFRPHVLPNIRKLVTGREEPVQEIHNPHSADPAGRVSSLVRLMYYSLDYILGYWFVLRRRIVQGDVIIFDRYFYDFMVDPKRSRLSLPGWIPKLVLRMIPKPCLVFVLRADAAEIFSRKQELGIAEIERLLETYWALAMSRTDLFVVLDAEQSPGAVVSDALHAVVGRTQRHINNAQIT